MDAWGAASEGPAAKSILAEIRRLDDKLTAAGLAVVGPGDARRRAAFVALEVDQGLAMKEELHDQGVFGDFRPRHPGARRGVTRISASSASFGYEIEAMVDAVARWQARIRP